MKAYKFTGEGYTIYSLITDGERMFTTAVIDSDHSINLSITESGLKEDYLIEQQYIECDVAEAKSALFGRIGQIIVNIDK